MEASVINNLVQFRRKRGLTAIELAKEIGVTRQTIYAMETGAYVPNTTVALKLAQVLDHMIYNKISYDLLSYGPNRVTFVAPNARYALTKKQPNTGIKR